VEIDNLKEKAEEIKNAQLILNNIQAGAEERFKFTKIEINALNFIDDLLNATLKSFEE